jgi:hypothetical protein
VPIVVACECGKKFRARDEDAGKRSRCPGCQRGVTIPGGTRAVKSAPPPPIAPAPATATKPTGPAIHITRGHLVLIIVSLVIAAVALFIEYGPARTHREWEQISEQARYDITDVVIRSIQSLHSQLGLGGGPGGVRTRPTPSVTGLAIIDTGVSWTIPKTVGFSGISTEGPFKGTYHTRTGEVDCDLFFWGAKLKVTGRVKQGNTTAEINGKPAVILPPPPGP